MLRSANAWIDGYYDLMFTPQIVTASSFAPSSSVMMPKEVSTNVTAGVKTQKCATGNFAVQDKLSAKAL
ncbi:MAG: hypothetical protein LBG15_08955 [Dysgonamonadaceae bacterium]|nr:hypothetical protein [Dysgonamonadaceae bacterium]